MRVLFANPPWWVGQEGDKRRIRLWGKDNRPWRRGVRAGSRWPHTYVGRSAPGNFLFGDYLPYPFFLGYATTYVARETGAHVEMRDSIALAETDRSFENYVRDGNFDYIIIESATPSWERDVQWLRRLAKITRAELIVTGPIATLGEKILDSAPITAIIKGEYEKGVVKVINGAQGIVEFDLLTLEEMNAAPFPYWEAAIAHRYCDGNPRGQLFPHAQVWSSRGCPFKCIFCVWPSSMTGNDPDGTQKRSVRQYTPEYMEAYLTEIVARYKFKSIYFDDDTFNIGNRHVERMSAVMRKIGVPWSAMCRADTIGLDLWRLMKESGCFGVKLGFESGNQFVVDKIVNKHLDLEFARQAVEEIKKAGMTIHGTFTYGLPGETSEQMQDTKKYLRSLDLDTWQESGTAEIEGSPLHTLTSKGTLEKYEGAQMDAGYQRATDGNIKFQQLAAQLRHSGTDVRQITG